MNTNTNAAVTFEKVQTGIFKVLLNGATTDWEIVNGHLGVSGYGTNTYGLHNMKTEKVIWIGTLASAKKGIAYTLTHKKGAAR